MSAAPKSKSIPASGEKSLELARRVLSIEADAVRALIGRIDESFLAAINLILASRGRVVVSGIGKSGHVARKIASTLASTGTSAYFVHAAEASHGDLGMVRPEDVFICISYSGESAELLDIVPLVKRQGAKLIALTGEAFVQRMFLQPTERVMCILPMFHINAVFYSLTGSLAAGATLILEPRFSASRFWEVAHATRATEVNTIAAAAGILMRRPREEYRAGHCLRKMFGAPLGGTVCGGQ